MATYFSNQFAAAGTETAAFDAPYRSSQGDLGGYVRYSIARATTDGTSNDDSFRMFRACHSSKRLWSLQFQVASTPSQGTISVGLYLSGFNHDGAEVDLNIFESAQSVTSGLALADVLTGVSLTNLDRGKTLWELSGAYSSDPNTFFDITFDTPTGITTATPVEILMVAGFLETD